MFNFFKKETTLVAPISGKVVSITEVPDPVFAEKMTGDGIAIIPDGDFVVAPCDATVTFVFGTKHAVGLTTKDGLELLIHVGLDTVKLGGEGFEALVSVDQVVKAGTPLLKFDRDFITEKGYPLISPFIITNMDLIKNLSIKELTNVTAGKDIVIGYKL